jgi:DNA-binding response OmpR family regulator
MRVLVVEDEPKLAELLRRALVEQGLAADVAKDGEEGERMGRDPAIDAVVLDVMLPKKDGRDVLRALRAARPTLPVMMLTAMSGPAAVVKGLDLGADDYLAKPFALSEFLARVRALLRRAAAPIRSSTVVVSDLVIDLSARTVSRAGVPIALTPREYALLVFLASRLNRAVARAEIGEHVVDREFEASSNSIDVSISGLRAKLGEPGLVRTVRGVGYRLAPPEAP